MSQPTTIRQHVCTYNLVHRFFISENSSSAFMIKAFSYGGARFPALQYKHVNPYFITKRDDGIAFRNVLNLDTFTTDSTMETLISDHENTLQTV